MPVLPSGRFVGIMSERARYHAARLRLRVTENTPHHSLYPLIDILIEQSGSEGSGSEAYGFSGHTLASKHWIRQWKEADRAAFLDWIREPAQVRTIEQARRRLLAEKSLPREQSYTYPQRLYSLLHHRVSTLPMQRASVQQWQRTLLNMKRDGIRHEELNWSGILRFLSRQPASLIIDKAVVLGAMNFSAIQPRVINELECDHSCRLPWREVAQKMAAYQLHMAGLPAQADDVAVVRYISSEPAYRIGVKRQGGRALAEGDRPCWFVLGPYGQVVAHPDKRQQRLFFSSDEAIQVAELHAMRNHRLRCNLTYRAQYEYMSLHGGDDYREWLVTLPEYQHTHFNGHFFERNVLLHIRTKVRQTRDGAQVLFIEEMQSDWQQASHLYGSRCGIPIAPFRKEWSSLALKLMLLHVVEQGLDGLAWADGAVHELRYDRVLTPLRRLYDEELPNVLNRLARPWGGRVSSGAFATRQPWLHAARNKDSWKVVGGAGKFATRARYSRQQAVELIARHSKAVALELPVLMLPPEMRGHIAEYGLPLFGEQHLNPQGSRAAPAAADDN